MTAAPDQPDLDTILADVRAGRADRDPADDLHILAREVEQLRAVCCALNRIIADDGATLARVRHVLDFLNQAEREGWTNSAYIARLIREALDQGGQQ